MRAVLRVVLFFFVLTSSLSRSAPRIVSRAPRASVPSAPDWLCPPLLFSWLENEKDDDGPLCVGDAGCGPVGALGTKIVASYQRLHFLSQGTEERTWYLEIIGQQTIDLDSDLEATRDNGKAFETEAHSGPCVVYWSVVSSALPLLGYSLGHETNGH